MGDQGKLGAAQPVTEGLAPTAKARSSRRPLLTVDPIAAAAAHARNVQSRSQPDAITDADVPMDQAAQLAYNIDQVKNMVAEVMGKHLSTDILGKVKKHALVLSQKVDALQRTNAKIAPIPRAGLSQEF